MSMSRMGFARRSGIEVEPTCSMLRIGRPDRRFSRAVLAVRNSVAQEGSWEDSSIGGGAHHGWMGIDMIGVM